MWTSTGIGEIIPHVASFFLRFPPIFIEISETERVLQILDIPCVNEPTEQLKVWMIRESQWKVSQGSIEFHDVWFSYPKVSGIVDGPSEKSSNPSMTEIEGEEKKESPKGFKEKLREFEGEDEESEGLLEAEEGKSCDFVLQGFSASIPGGSRVAIVGGVRLHSSFFLNLLCSLFFQ